MATLIGSTAGGGVNDFFAAQELAASEWVCAASGDIGTMSVLIRASAFTSLTLAIYAGSGTLPTTLLGQTVAITSTAAGVKTAAMVAPVTVTASTVYWLAFLALGGSVDYTATTGGSQGYEKKNGQASLPNPWGASDGNASPHLPIRGDSTAAAPVLGPSFVAIPLMR